MRQVLGIKIDDIAENGIAPLFGDKGNRFAHAALFAEGEEQVFGVVAVVKPLSRCEPDQHVDGGLRRAGAPRRMADHVDQVRVGKVVGQVHVIRGQQEDPAKAKMRQVIQRRGQFRRVLCDHDRERTLAQGLPGAMAGKGLKRGVDHLSGSACIAFAIMCLRYCDFANTMRLALKQGAACDTCAPKPAGARADVCPQEAVCQNLRLPDECL